MKKLERTMIEYNLSMLISDAKKNTITKVKIFINNSKREILKYLLIAFLWIIKKFPKI